MYRSMMSLVEERCSSKNVTCEILYTSMTSTRTSITSSFEVCSPTILPVESSHKSIGKEHPKSVNLVRTPSSSQRSFIQRKRRLQQSRTYLEIPVLRPHQVQ